MLARFGFLCCFAALICGVFCELGCPPPEDILPCTCYQVDKDVKLECRNLTDAEDLVKVFQNDPTYHFKEFLMTDSTLEYIPHQIFDDVEVKFMQFERVTFANTFNQVPNDPGLEEIVINQVKVMAGWDWKTLSAFKNLTRISIWEVPVEKLSTDFRPNVSKKLKVLNMKRCQIKEFQDDEFVEFTDLEDLVVSYDQIDTVKRSIFPRQNKLRNLNFDYNKISSIPEDLFTNMPDLMFISFRGNQLSVLPENTFKPVINYLIYLDVEMNPIKCDCLFVWLLRYRHLYLGGKCYSPKRLYERNFYDLTVKDFRCETNALPTLEEF